MECGLALLALLALTSAPVAASALLPARWSAYTALRPVLIWSPSSTNWPCFSWIIIVRLGVDLRWKRGDG
jgi:hypothetical protein